MMETEKLKMSETKKAHYYCHIEMLWGTFAEHKHDISALLGYMARSIKNAQEGNSSVVGFSGGNPVASMCYKPLPTTQQARIEKLEAWIMLYGHLNVGGGDQNGNPMYYCLECHCYSNSGHRADCMRGQIETAIKKT